MKSLRFLDRRAGYSLGSIGLLLGMMAPAVLPAFASAGQLTSRSITMSSATAGATAAYDLKFTAATTVAAGGGLVIDFCTASPLINTTCTPPDINTSGVGVGTVNYNGSPAAANGTASAINSNAGIKWVAGTSAGFSQGQDVEIPLTGIVNPSTEETFYARITTYSEATGGSASLDTYTDASDVGTYADTGSVALSTSKNVDVSAYVLESMTFCVANTEPTKNCSGLTFPADNPSMTLGEPIGVSGIKALDTVHVSQGTDYAQLSTNASGGAVVNLKSSTTGCGGLVLNGINDASHCGIKPQNTDGASHDTTINNGNALFGIKFGTTGPASDATDADQHSGDLTPAGNYNTSRFYLDADGTSNSGILSTYGSAFFNSGNAPVNNINIPFTFGASVANNTPAGQYGATLNLVAVGTF